MSSSDGHSDSFAPLQTQDAAISYLGLIHGRLDELQGVTTAINAKLDTIVKTLAQLPQLTPGEPLIIPLTESVLQSQSSHDALRASLARMENEIESLLPLPNVIQMGPRSAAEPESECAPSKCADAGEPIMIPLTESVLQAEASHVALRASLARMEDQMANEVLSPNLIQMGPKSVAEPESERSPSKCGSCDMLSEPDDVMSQCKSYEISNGLSSSESDHAFKAVEQSIVGMSHRGLLYSGGFPPLGFLTPHGNGAVCSM
jgi:hypothetical protein